MSTAAAPRVGRLVRDPVSARPFEFGAPIPLGDDELTVLRQLHDVVAARLGATWTELLRVPCTVEATVVEPVAWDHVAAHEAATAHHAVVELLPGPGSALVTIPGPLALVLVDLLLGGAGRSTGATRPLTAIDAELLTSLLDASSAAVVEGYEAAGTTGVRLDLVGLDPEELEVAERLASLVAVTLEVTLGEQPPVPMSIALERGAAEAVVGGATQQAESDGDVPARQLMQDTLRDVAVQVVVEFPTTAVRSTELLRLGVGDVVRLDCAADGLLRMRVGDEQFAAVRAARSGARLACQVISTRTAATDAANEPEPLRGVS